MNTESIDRLLDYHLATGRYPGAIVHVERDGHVLARRAVGRLHGAAESPMREDAIFRIASLTKPIVSAVALMMVDEGLLEYDAPVYAYLPPLRALRVAGGGAPARAPSIRDLLRHTSGLAYLNEYRDAGAREIARAEDIDGRLVSLSPDEALAALARVPLDCEPGTAFRYGFSTDVLGLVIECVLDRRLDDILRERVFEPLGMRDTAFTLEPAARERFATGLPDDAGWHQFCGRFDAAQRAGSPFRSAGGGLLSTIDDYLRFARMLVGGGELDGVRVLPARAVERICSDQLDAGVDGPANLTGPGFGFGFGLAVRLDWGVSAYPTVTGEATWSGITGPVMYLHPRERWIAMSFSCNMSTRMLARMEFRRAAQALIAAR